MTEDRFPGPAQRFASVGFSEIVQVRNRVLALLAAGHRVWRFEGGEPYMPTPEPIKEAMTLALARNETRYAPSSGIPELRRAILAKVRDRNHIAADDESPIVVNGGMHGLFAAFATLLDPGDEVLMLSPYWTPIVDVVRYHGAVPVLVPADEARRDGIAAALGRRKTPRTKVLYWNSPTNPTGAVFTRGEIEQAGAFVRENGLALISDEAYEDLIYEGEGHVSPASFPGVFERTISVFTLSKTYSMTGWRAGYVLVPKRWRAAMQTAVLYSINGVSTPTQWAMLEALSLPPDFLEEAKAGYRRRRDALVAGLRAAGFELETPRAALYLFPKIPAAFGPGSTAAATALLDTRRIATVPGIVFGPEGEGHLRFSFSVAEETIRGGVEALQAEGLPSPGPSPAVREKSL